MHQSYHHSSTHFLLPFLSRLPQMDSAPTLSSAPTRFSSVSRNSSSSSSSDREEVVNHRRFNRLSPAPNFHSRGYALMTGSEISMSCFAMVLLIWLLVSTLMIGYAYGPDSVWIGPNTSILSETNPIFVKSVKVEELYDSKSGLQLFGFHEAPPLDIIANWSEHRLVSVSHKSHMGWPYYLNEGASLNISYNVKPEGYSVRLMLVEGMTTRWLVEKPDLFDQDRALSLNQIQGSGMIQMKISESSSYHIAVANPNLKNVEVELDIDVKAVLYDTKQSFYKCTFSNGECTFNAMSLAGNSFVLTSPAPRQGVSVEEEEWYVRFSYQPRWSSYAIITGFFICFMLVSMKPWSKCLGEERDVTENVSASERLLANKDDDSSGMVSSNKSLAADGPDLEDCIGKERLCAICFDAQRDCFFLPCGHCVSCYSCGTKTAETAGSCPICRRKMKKVKRMFTF